MLLPVEIIAISPFTYKAVPVVTALSDKDDADELGDACSPSSPVWLSKAEDERANDILLFDC